MGEWLATVEFADGTRRYARYSTVVESVLSGLYPSADFSGPRAAPAGEPTRGHPEPATSPAHALVPVVITVEPDDRRWHALFDPWRDVLLGPHSPHHAGNLQGDFSLLLEVSGVKHLSAGAPATLCGRRIAGSELEFHRPAIPFGAFADLPDVPDVDLFAEWGAGTVCRECLLTTV